MGMAARFTASQPGARTLVAPDRLKEIPVTADNKTPLEHVTDLASQLNGVTGGALGGLTTGVDDATGGLIGEVTGTLDGITGGTLGNATGGLLPGTGK